MTNSGSHPVSNIRTLDGVVALMTVIMIGVILLTVGISAAMIGQTEIALAGFSDREYAARSLANACIDEGIFRLKLNSSYTGGTIPINGDTCTLVISGSGSSRTLTAAGTSAEFSRNIIVGLSLKQNIAANARAWHIDSWSESNPP